LDTRLSAFRFPFFFRNCSSFVIAGHSRSKNGVTSFAYDPAIHAAAKRGRIYRLDFASRRSAWTTGLNPVVTRTWCCQPHWASLPPQSRINAANLDG
jgi:hypothetical protein